MSKATKEFVVGIEKYTPQVATVNGVNGHLWTKRVLQNGAWVHQGQQHVRSAAQEIEVEAAFVVEFDPKDATDWDTL